MVVVHLNDFNIVILENLSSLAGEPEQGVHAHGVVRGKDDGNLLRGFGNGGAFLIGVAGGADDQRLALCHGGGQQFRGESVEGEIDGAVGSAHGSGNILPHIVRGGQFRAFIQLHSLLDRLAHAAGNAGYKNLYHGRSYIRLKLLSRSASLACFSAASGTRGRRISQPISPRRARAAFTGTGFTSRDMRPFMSG